MTRALLVALAACGGAPHHATLADCAWLQGTWHASEHDSHWQLIDGALWGIALDAHGGFEVNYIADSDDDGKPAPISTVSIENGRDVTRFPLKSATPARLEFADIASGRIVVTKTATGWRGEFTPPGKPAVVFDAQPGKLEGTRELEDAELAFMANTAGMGADGWTAQFAPDGAMWRNGRRIEGAAIHEAIARTLAHGDLSWTPVAAGARGDVGFTLGTYTFDDHHGSYATIWKKQPDGSWKVLFDLGCPGG